MSEAALLETIEAWCERHTDSHRAAELLLAFMRGDCVHAFYVPETHECDLCGAKVTFQNSNAI